MSDAYAQFEQRRDVLTRKHQELAKGYTAKLGTDGLITLVPARRRSNLPLRLFAASVVAFFVFKSITLALIGPITYQERIDALADGTKFEKGAAWVMQADQVTTRLAEFLLPTMP
jgi:hypothetical protein